MPWLLLLALADAPAPADRKARVEAARAVVAAVVEAARADRKLARPRSGDDLARRYVRAAAAAAGKLPDDRAAWAFAVGLGVALDRSATMRNNFLTRTTWRDVESDAERKARLEALGEPTLHGRHDLAQHFAVSAALTALFGAKSAETAGLLKEWLDSGEGGSGFSFADLAADLAGIELAARLLKRPAGLADVAANFAAADYCPAPKGLAEGLDRKTFEARFGSTTDERFLRELEALRRKVRALPGYRPKND